MVHQRPEGISHRILKTQELYIQKEINNIEVSVDNMQSSMAWKIVNEMEE